MTKKTTIQNMLDSDYNESIRPLATKENRDILETIVRQMGNATNRRIRNLESTPIGVFSPALKQFQKNNKGSSKWSTKGVSKMNTNQLLHEYSRLKKFLQADSSTLRGWKKIRNNLAKRTGAKKLFANDFKTKRSATIWHNREKRFWDIYNKLKDNKGGVLTDLNSNRVQSVLYKIQSERNKANTDDKILASITNYVNSLYEDYNSMNDRAYLDALNDEKNVEEILLHYGEISSK